MMASNGIPEQLNDKNRNRIAKNIGTHAGKDLGYALGFKDADLQRFKANNIEDLQGRNGDMLGEWVNKNAGDGILDKFEEACKEAGLQHLANELKPPAIQQPRGQSSPQEGASAGPDPSISINNAQGCSIQIGTSHDNKIKIHKGN